MKNFLAFLCVVLTVVALAKAEVCEIDRGTLQVGETFLVPGDCQLHKCVGQNRFSTIGCPSGVPGVASGYSCTYVPQNNALKYPDCCPRYDCK